jgi:hypothetical protein
MGKLKEQYFGIEDVECWREVETGALLGLPDAGSLKRTSIEAVAALPAGTAISSVISISAEGATAVLLKQLGLGLDDDVFTPLLGLAAPSIAPESRILMGSGRYAVGSEVVIFPQWRTLSDSKRAPRPTRQDAEWRLQLPKPPATWPWDIKRALATLAAAGGGRLSLTVMNIARDARIMRIVSDLQDGLIAAGYSLPDDRAVLAGQLNCKAMLEDPALLGFEVSVSVAEECETVGNLVSLALFGTLAGEGRLDGSDGDLRLLAGSRQVPDRIVPTAEEAAGLAASRSLRSCRDPKRWLLGQGACGIDVSLSENDRARHLYVIGATGTGKSTLLKSLILQDIHAGEGVIVFDPHGDLAEDVVAAVPAQRLDDVVYADAADDNGRFAVDLLPATADSSSFEIAADMLVSIFKGAMYSANPEGFGPMFESYFRNALALLVGADPTERCLVNFTRVFDEPGFRRKLVEACAVPSVRGFWQSAGRTGGEAALENITPYITSKLTRFIVSKHARAMFPTSEKCLSFDEIMDDQKILILRCPKGALGEGLTELAMSASLMKIRAAAMARAGRRDRRPVRVYIDEFQNCRGDSLQSLLAEGRKFGISLALANQSLGQIGGTDNRSIGSATLANVGNLITFRLGAADAIKLAPWLDEPERWRELCRLPDFTMNARLLENGTPVQFQRLRSCLTGERTLAE